MWRDITRRGNQGLVCGYGGILWARVHTMQTPVYGAGIVYNGCYQQIHTPYSYYCLNI